MEQATLLGGVGQELDKLMQEKHRLKAQLRELVRHVSTGAGHCRLCSAPIFWVRHNGGANTPYDQDGFNHFRTCPRAAEARKKETR